jgi:hypothetical protein
MSVALVLVYGSVISGFFPLLAALVNFRWLDDVLKLMVVFCFISILPDMAVFLFRIHNNLPLMHLFDLLAVLFFTLIYCKAFYKPVLKKITLILGSVSAAIMIGNAIFIEGLLVYPSISNTVLSLFLVPLSLIYFYQLLTRQEFVHIEKQGLFWINAGVLFYFAINIFLFMLYTKISSAERNDYYMMQSVTNIIANLLYSVGLLCKPQKTASSRY